MNRAARRPATGLALLGAALVALALVRTAIGPAAQGGTTGLAIGIPAGEILGLRMTAVAGATMLGVALSLSGLALQVLLRNPLASPFVLGVSSGAGLGVALALALPLLLGLPAARFGGEVAGASIGALASIAIVGWLGRARRGGDPTTLVLTGVVVGSISSAASMLVEQLVPFGMRGDLLSWMAGRLPELPTRASLFSLGIAAAGGWTVLAASARSLDVAMLSDEEAASSGVDLARLRLRLFLAGGLLAAIAVAYAGPIGFIGLIGPHAARRIVGPHHAILVPASALAGAGLLVAADIARQCIDLGTGRLPVGVVTALVGGPAFLWLLRGGRWAR